MCRMAGYERGELIGSAFADYFADPARAHDGVRQTFASGAVTNYDLVLNSKSGRKAIVSFNASVYRGADEKIEGIFASARDISEQARLQSQLTEQQSYNRSLIEASADSLFAISLDGMITDVNEEATRLTGFSRKHLINSHFDALFTDKMRASAGVLQTLSEGRVIGYELVLVTRQGRRIPVSFNAGVFTDSTGNALGILAGARDATQQKALEQQLREQQSYTRSLIDSNIDALMTTDQLGVLTDVNPQMEKLTGYSRAELLGQPFKRFFSDPVRAADGIKLVLQQGTVKDYELTAISRENVETVVSYNATVFNDRNGKLQGVFAAARDVTERKQFEERLQEKNVEMENASLSKDRFLAGMSHELRTPLNAIIGFTDALLLGVSGTLSEEQRGQLSMVRSSGGHLLSLINDLLDVAKIESGNLELHVESVSCNELLRNVAATLRPLAEEKRLRFVVDALEEGVRIHVDERSIRQVLINLCNNAIKFTDEGEVRVKLEQAQEAGRTVTRIGVLDTGIGISSQDEVQLFQAFRQLDGSSTRRFEGTGLGLHLSQKLAELMGGWISYRPNPSGQGSIFTLTLIGK